MNVRSAEGAFVTAIARRRSNQLRSRTSASGRYCCKSLLGVLNENSRDRRCVARRREGTISFHLKSITDLRSGVEKRRSGKEVQRSTFARFLGLFDFRLLQQNRHKCEVPTASSYV